MKRLVTILCVMAAIMLPVTSSCSSTRHNATGKLHPDEIFTVTDDDIANETRIINLGLQGQWKYNGPSVGLSGKDLIAGIAKPVAKSKLKKKLKEAFKKIGLDKARPEFTFNVDGTSQENFDRNVIGLGMSVDYSLVELSGKVNGGNGTPQAFKLIKLIEPASSNEIGV